MALVMAFEAVGQPRRVDLALVLLEGRDVRVAEHGKAIGTQFDALADGVEAGRDGLVRQSIDQIEVDAGDAGPPQACGRGSGLIENFARG